MNHPQHWSLDQTLISYFLAVIPEHPVQTFSKSSSKRDAKFASNISKITSTLAVVHQEKATMHLECTVIEKIVQTAFPDEIIDAYNLEYTLML